MTGAGPKRRVLVVEDEPLVAMMLEEMLLEIGMEAVGPAATLEDALALARDVDVDLAILDLKLAGQRTYPVARVLRERKIPYIFATGYGPGELDEDFRSDPTLAKPFDQQSLEIALSKVLP